jgi:hypothetical protein
LERNTDLQERSTDLQERNKVDARGNNKDFTQDIDIHIQHVAGRYTLALPVAAVQVERLEHLLGGDLVLPVQLHKVSFPFQFLLDFNYKIAPMY